MNQLFSLTGKVAIVTGGAGFFGTPISTALAEAGAHVVIASRNVSTGELLAAGLSSRGFLATAMFLDLENEASIRALVETVMAMFGRIDILVNNAVSRQGFKNQEEIEI